ncbi:proton-coupled folate transporter-like isoform X2 [Corticium candelabrum]|uniref:proton-coupled folate transporter-like isoform X2 n=1 Tax=Corticium candelabrum TaxID=121492 RepID=UPI002E263493|nr:proton-coupled folate transporter-like isoform X2 [Corticium candelabrum]
MSTRNDSINEELEKRAQSDASNWILYIDMTVIVPGMVWSLLMGGWSDKHGRKLLLLAPLVGYSIEAFLFLVIMKCNLAIAYLFIGNAIAGITGGMTTLFAALYSYMTDITNPVNRTARMGIFVGMLFVGGGIGRLLAGIILDHVGSYAVEGTALTCYIITALYVTLLMDHSSSITATEESTTEELTTESVTSEGTTETMNSDDDDEKLLSDDKLCSIKGFVETMKVFKKKNRLKPSWCLVVLIIMDGINVLVYSGYPAVQYLYFLGYPLCWSSSVIGYYLGLFNLVGFLSSSVILAFLNKVLHLRDTTIILLASSTWSASFVLEAFATSTWAMFLVPVVSLLNGTIPPALLSLMSGCVRDTHHGALFSIVSSFETLCSVISELVFNPLYAAVNRENINFLPSSGAIVFLVTAVLILLSLVLMTVFHFSKANVVLTHPRKGSRLMSESEGGDETDL